MPIAFRTTGVAVSGTDVPAILIYLGGMRDVRLLVKNAGSAGLSAAKVRVRDSEDGPAAIIDSTTFATLAASAVASLLVQGPIEWLELLATCASGTSLDVSGISGLEP